MEAVVGIIVLFELIAIIQIMCMKKQILQKIEVQQNGIEKILEVTEQKTQESLQNQEDGQELLYNDSVCNHNNSVCNIEETDDLCIQRQEQSPEELLNQVLSEVFS